MRQTFGMLACAVAVGVAASGVLLAQQNPRVAGKILLLDNERAVEGEIELRGELYTVRRSAGELTIPANKVLAVCASLEEAFQLLCSQANLRDGNERMRLARWCQNYGLREQAIAEAKATLQLHPGNLEAEKLLTILQRPSMPIPTPPMDDFTSKPAPTLEIEVVGECLALFATKVQPILMNTCSRCHSTGSGGSFILSRPTEANGRQALQSNLLSSIKQICFEQPEASPLTQKACCAHGGAEVAALPNRQTPPFTILQSWVEMVTVRNPQLKSYGTKGIASSSPTLAGNQPRGVFGAAGSIAPKALEKVPAKVNEQVLANFNSTANGDTLAAPVARVIPSEPALGGLSTTPRTMSSTPADNWQPKSEFDPMIFNRMWHSGR